MQTNDNDKILTQLTQRLDGLEKQNRRLVRTAWILGAVLLLVVSLGAGREGPDSRVVEQPSDTYVIDPSTIILPPVTQDVVRTKNLQIVDDENHLRADMKLVDGEPELGLYDKDGTMRAELGLLVGEPHLELKNSAGNTQVSLRISSGNPGLMLFDESGMYRASLRLDHGNPWLTIVDWDGSLRATLSLDSSGSPSMAMYGLNGINSYFP